MNLILKLGQGHKYSGERAPDDLPILRAGFIRFLNDKRLDYSGESLALLDKIVTKRWPEQKVADCGIVLLVGTYVGEVIKRHLGWRWVRDKDRNWHLEFKRTVKFKTCPFGKVQRRLLRGKTESLESYFYALQLLTNGKDIFL
jgi:hypothetical protein